VVVDGTGCRIQIVGPVQFVWAMEIFYRAFKSLATIGKIAT